MLLKIRYVLFSVLFFPVIVFAQDWQAVGDETVENFRKYLSINTANPPGISEQVNARSRI